jgi:hypothetical protein
MSWACVRAPVFAIALRTCARTVSGAMCSAEGDATDDLLLARAQRRHVGLPL